VSTSSNNSPEAARGSASDLSGSQISATAARSSASSTIWPRRDAHDLALDLMAAYEGSALLASTMRDPGVLSRAARRIDRWIDAA
jgi:hypothetical protein